jgi:RNA polymerase sigma-70 factor (ECF subfamily)
VPVTSVSLLDRLRSQPSPNDWQRLLDVYEPFIRQWLRDRALSEDRDDLVQDIMAVLVRELPRFKRQRPGSFRAWLRIVTAHRVSLWWRQRRGPARGAGGSAAVVELAELEDPASPVSRQWDLDHDRHVAQRLLEMLESEFSPHTWRAFRRQAVDGLPAAEVAAEMGTTVNAALVAKSKVLARLREEARELLD